MPNKPLIFFFLFYLHIYLGYGQENLLFNRLSVEGGLSQTSVLSIVQDSSGYIWLGTRYGLNKFDSYKIKVYKHDVKDSTSISGNEYIGTLLSDTKGTLWVGTSNGLNRYCPSTESFKQILHNPKNKNSISSNFINKIIEDDAGNILVATRQGLNILTDKKNLLFKKILEDHNVYTIAKGRHGEIWAGTSKGLVQLKRRNKENYNIVYHKKISEYINSIPENNLFALCIDGNTIWIGTGKTGLLRYNIQNGSFVNYTSTSNTNFRLSSNNIRKIFITKDRKLWIATQKGINVVDTSRTKVSIYQYDANDNNSLSQNSVYDIYQDRQGIIWIGTYFGGANMIYPEHDPFNVYRSNNQPNSISSNVVSQIAEDKKSNLWIGTEAEGLNYYNVKENTFKTYKNNPSDPNSISSNLIKAVYIDNDNVWIGAHLGGLDFFDSQKKRFIHYKDHRGPTSNNVNYLLEDSQKRFWVATGKGLRIFDKKTREFLTYKASLHKNNPITTSVIQYLYEDRKQNIWVASVGGVYVLKHGTDKFTYFDLSNHVNVSSNNITCIIEDALDNIWIGTLQGGVIQYNPTKNRFTNLTETDGLAGNTIAGIVEEKPGIIWLSTNNGLSRLEINTKRFRNYDVNDRLPGNVFNFRSFFKDRNGKMYFGSFEGLVSFHPSEIKINTLSPAVVFTDVKLFNQNVPANSPHRIKNLYANKKQINLAYKHNVITVEFTNMNYIKPQKNSYAYYLDGFEKDWNYTDQSSVTYTNLNEGTYKLLVKGKNNDGVWSNEVSELTIVIAPPLWRTWWAYIIYILILAAVSFGIIRFILIREMLKREKEVHQMKLDFFTNISHEIRTPLTLIVAPLEKMLSKPEEQVQQSQLKVIKNNADRLIKLVTELLDFRKTETGHLELKATEENIVVFSKHVFSYFNDIATIRNINYSFKSEIENIMIYFDKDQIEKVLFNLLSNAFKFVHDGGNITLSVIDKQRNIEILIEDDGQGIPKDKQQFLFTSFFQVAPDKIGSGVGLALCKNIIELHYGEISLKSTPKTEKEKGCTCVRVLLKKGTVHFNKNNIALESNSSYEKPKNIVYESHKQRSSISEIDKKTILVVEDNDDMRSFICASLEDKYNIISANNGSEGIETAFSKIPDLIISDVMMPVKDGLELCSALKNDARTDFIPILLLTARTDSTHQLSGAKAGADLYMIKPFSTELLHANIYNLLYSRESLKQKFAKIVRLEPTHIVIDSPDEVFIEKIMKLVESNISDNNFNVPWLADQMGMSQPILYKKVRALTNLSVNDFIKSIRIKRAADLLSQNVYNISEVAYQVGFSDPKYFTKEFKKQTGKSPTDFIKHLSEN